MEQKTMTEEETMQETCERAIKGVIFVSSPLRPRWTDPEAAKKEYAKNIERAVDACRYVSQHGYLPLAPHLYFTQFLNDDAPEERAMGIRLGLQWLEQADEVWCFGDRVSEGMQMEIDAAREKGIPYYFMTENFGDEFTPYRKLDPDRTTAPERSLDPGTEQNNVGQVPMQHSAQVQTL